MKCLSARNAFVRRTDEFRLKTAIKERVFFMNQAVIIVSEKQPQSGQKERSSNNFTLADFHEDARLTVRAYYDYDEPTQREAADIVFDIKADRTGKDPVVLNGISSGYVMENTHHRNLYIANPRNAAESFTVKISV